MVWSTAGLCLVLCIVCVLSGLLSDGAAATEEPSDAPQLFMVPMRDGVRLATDVLLPEGRGPWPALLLRTPYGRRTFPADREKNYVVVFQDLRGRFDSEGRANYFVDDGWGERQDGLDTVCWILAQPWCNGKIATTGNSSLGMAQNQLAGTNPPGVVCQNIMVAPGSFYDTIYPGGIVWEGLWLDWLRKHGWPAENVQLWLDHPTYDAFWESLNYVARIEEQRVSIPALHTGGWFDLFCQGSIDTFVARSRIANNQWLVMGPWVHSMVPPMNGDVTFPVNAKNKPPLGLLWNDYWLLGKQNGLLEQPHVFYYVMGACGEEGAPGNMWRTADSWPIPATETKLFLAPNNALARTAPSASGAYDYVYNPSNPVPSRRLVPRDQRELEARPDVIVFSTPPLTEPLEVTGRIRVELYASSSAEDTMFAAKLCDVYPDGRSIYITEGVLRAACRESISKLTPIEPGKQYEFSIDLGSTSLVVNTGHRLRLDVTSSNSPDFPAHPNVFAKGDPRPATQTLHYGPDAPSALVLPVVDSASQQARVWKP